MKWNLNDILFLAFTESGCFPLTPADLFKYCRKR